MQIPTTTSENSRVGPAPSDAVAALLVLEDGKYVMQLRDDIPGIFFPAHWGCFGGGIEEEETPELALKRELYEELEFEIAGEHFFTSFDMDFSPLGYGSVRRVYYEVQVPHSAMNRFVLHEGVEFRAIAGQDLMNLHKVAPYDALAIWMHTTKRSTLAKI